MDSGALPGFGVMSFEFLDISGFRCLWFLSENITTTCKAFEGSARHFNALPPPLSPPQQGIHSEG